MRPQSSPAPKRQAALNRAPQRPASARVPLHQNRGGRDNESNPQRGSKATGILAAAVLAVGALFYSSGSPPTVADEHGDANWQEHIEELNTRARNGQSAVKRVAKNNGQVAFSNVIGLAALKPDTETTGAVATALRENDVAKANQVLQDAQDIPPVPEVEDAPVPELKPEVSQGMSSGILWGDTQFYHLFLFDCCAEDGDVVQVLLNGQPFATVPITHAGATLSVPFSAGSPTEVTILGVRDGCGGITVACASSQGDFFMRALAVGETQLLRVVP